MFFTKSARILAVLALGFGLLRVMMGFSIAWTEPAEAREAARARYIGGKSTGEVIDKGIYTIFFAVVLGTLAEVSVSLRKRSE